MASFIQTFFGLFLIFLGISIGYLLRRFLATQQIASAESEAKRLVNSAKEEANKLVIEGQEKSVKLIEEAKKEARERERTLNAAEERIQRIEAKLDERAIKISNAEEVLVAKAEKMNALRQEIEQLKEQETKRLSTIANLSIEEARAELFNRVESGISDDLARRSQKLVAEGEEHFAERAREIIVTALQRYAGSHSADVTTTAVALPNEDLKGRIIGKEGRNIKALERATGCEILVDDAPGAIVISGFDPIRRHIAKVALEKLISDGRIQPARIEEVVEQAKTQIEAEIRRAGEAAITDVGIIGIDPRLIYLLGRLKFRTSYGQNVLLHSIEAAHVAGMVAAEVGANVGVAKQGALFHDIGKSIDHEVEGTHVEIGRKLLARFGVNEEVIKAMQSHHDEYPNENSEAIIVRVAESISAARPGARRDTVENYIKRLEDLERIANEFPGVEKSFAIQAGRELRIFVSPKDVDDWGAQKLARAIADQIESTLKYPGEIKVNVIRENRVVEFAR